MSRNTIPNYFVYGESVRHLDVGFLHVEMVSTRKNLHRGDVAAHKHPQLAQITFWTKGGGTYHIEDSSWTFSAPAISFVPSGVVHGFSVRPSSDAIVVSIANDALDDILKQHGSPALKAVFANRQVDKSDWHVIRTCMNLLLQEYGNRRGYHTSVMAHMAGVVLGYIARQQAAADVSIAEQSLLAQKLQHLVDGHFREKRSVQDYIRDLHTTQHRLDRATKTAFAMPVKQFILQRRLLEAKRLLQFTIRSAEDIAHELGFNDPAYFNREFKKHTGQSPGLWRSVRR
jgi:AraC family transcriptional regulator, transcriptional activator of pobA